MSPDARASAARALAWVAPPAAAAAALLLWDGRVRTAGAALIAAAIGAAAGAPARSGWLRFVHAVAEHVAVGAALALLAWESRGGPPRVATLALALMSVWFLAAYVETRATSLGFQVRVVPAERGIALLLAGAGLAVPEALEESLWAAVAVESAVLGRRGLAVWRSREPAGPAA